jgi:hypothetical protein
MYGREPLLPLNASALAPTIMSLDTIDPKSYVQDMTDNMAKVFAMVRRRQDLASRINAARRDDSQNRYVVKYSPGDPVLIYEPKAASTKVAYARQVPPPTDLTIPSKWRMLWSGPHPVMSGHGENTYKIFHIYQRKILTVNVSDMRLYQPFLEIPFSGIPQLRIPPPFSSQPHVQAPLRSLKSASDVQEIQFGDLFLATTPFNGFEPISVMKFISSSSDGKVVGQWMGAFKLVWHINTRLRVQQWFPGWFQPNTQEFYFTSKPIHHSHPPFTNLLSEDEIFLKDIFVFNFCLRHDQRLPKDVAQRGICKYRTMKIPAKTEKGPITYEDPAEEIL